ncbi:translation initiation factor IF-2 [Harryflintia acetispora]|uniref:translation initiation factor IF-2 n=1 Tax=Harryflintia acetispora TaxID=1849041 RepID=UPI00189ACBF9|nr:translation initiation factor IF-2 [Harryflintia acetispora]
MMEKYRVHEVAKDLEVPSKDVLTLLSEHFKGETIKHMTALSEQQLDLIFEHYTQKNMAENFDAYFAMAKAPEPAAPAPAAPAPAAPAAPQAPAGKAAAPAAHAQPRPAAQQRPGQRPGQGQQGGQRPQQQRNGGAQRERSQMPFAPKAPAAPAAPLDPAARKIEKKSDTKTVDMRSAQVNLDKYNERYEQIAPTNLQKKDNGVRKQKLNQRSAQRRRQQMSRKEIEAEKMRKLEVERQRRQKLEITIPEEISVGDLALKMKIQVTEVIKKLMQNGVMAGAGEIIDYDTAALVAMELGAKVEREVVVTIEERLFSDEEDDEKDLQERCPIVVVMGHVDHGKTSILDAIRNEHVTASEAGGITQHIGAYQVKVGERPITFLDTPGHEAFTAMRARGAQVTDVAILVVAADDGIMPQTVEAINHAKAAGISIIVAINKMDKPAANPERVKQELTEYELIPEEWGGDVICVPVSAVTKEGIDTLLEMVLLVADMKELKANPGRPAKGTVIEARLDTGRGPVATILVQNGTLRTGDTVIAGTAMGRVRVMTDDQGRKVDEAGPSMPVEITGLGEVPSAGDVFNAVADEKLARELVEKRKYEEKEEVFKSYHKVTLDNLFSQIAEGEVKELPVIVKADVQGSVEAVRQSLEKLSSDEVRVRVIHGAVGGVSKSDVMLAQASGAIIVGFNVRPDSVARDDAEREGVEIRLYRIIYDAIEDVKNAMKGLLAPKIREVDLGRAEVRQVYKISSVGTVSGCYVLEGKIERNAKIRVVRDNIIIADDELASLKRFKDDVKEVAQSYECGITLQKFNDIKEGDVFEAYILEEYRED